jgi:hypothetical protein
MITERTVTKALAKKRKNPLIILSQRGVSFGWPLLFLDCIYPSSFLLENAFDIYYTSPNDYLVSNLLKIKIGTDPERGFYIWNTVLPRQLRRFYLPEQ